MTKYILSLALILSVLTSGNAQFDEDQLGGWYMLFWNADLNNSKFGFQGDIQLRNWEVAGDLEQLLIRGGLTYKATDKALLTLGYGNITSGQFGDSDETSGESRVYQEALLTHDVSSKIQLKHRFRYEQRWVENQDFRTRYRYNLFLTIPLDDKLYLSFYNELFINGEREIGDSRVVELFDRNRLYGAVGYKIKSNLKVQLGMMRQTTDNWAKNQLQTSLHASF